MEKPWKPIKLCGMILKESHVNKRGARHDGSYCHLSAWEMRQKGSGRGQGHFWLCSEWRTPWATWAPPYNTHRREGVLCYKVGVPSAGTMKRQIIICKVKQSKLLIILTDVRWYKCTQRGWSRYILYVFCKNRKESRKNGETQCREGPWGTRALENAEGEPPLKALGSHWLWIRLPFSLKEEQRIKVSIQDGSDVTWTRCHHTSRGRRS